MLFSRPGGLSPPGLGLLCEPTTFWGRPWAQPGPGRYTKTTDVTGRRSCPRHVLRDPSPPCFSRERQAGAGCPTGHGLAQGHTSPLQGSLPRGERGSGCTEPRTASAGPPSEPCLDSGAGEVVSSAATNPGPLTAPMDTSPQDEWGKGGAPNRGTHGQAKHSPGLTHLHSGELLGVGGWLGLNRAAGPPASGREELSKGLWRPSSATGRTPRESARVRPEVLPSVSFGLAATPPRSRSKVRAHPESRGLGGMGQTPTELIPKQGLTGWSSLPRP